MQTLEKPMPETITGKHGGGRPRAAVSLTRPAPNAAPYTPADLADMKREYAQLYPRVKAEGGKMRKDADPADVKRFRELIAAGEKQKAYQNSRKAYKS